MLHRARAQLTRVAPRSFVRVVVLRLRTWKQAPGYTENIYIAIEDAMGCDSCLHGVASPHRRPARTQPAAERAARARRAFVTNQLVEIGPEKKEWTFFVPASNDDWLSLRTGEVDQWGTSSFNTITYEMIFTKGTTRLEDAGNPCGVPFDSPSPPPPPPPPPPATPRFVANATSAGQSTAEMPTWAAVVTPLLAVLLLGTAGFVFYVYRRECKGEPVWKQYLNETMMTASAAAPNARPSASGTGNLAPAPERAGAPAAGSVSPHANAGGRSSVEMECKL